MRFLHLILILFIYSCKQTAWIKKADKELLCHHFQQAAELYEKAYKKRENVSVKRKLAYCYFNLQAYDKSSVLYQSLLNTEEEKNLTDSFYFGYSLLAEGDMIGAKKQIENYLIQDSTNSLAKIILCLLEIPIFKTPNKKAVDFRSTYLSLVENKNRKDTLLSIDFWRNQLIFKGVCSMNNQQNSKYYSILKPLVSKNKEFDFKPKTAIFSTVNQETEQLFNEFEQNLFGQINLSNEGQTLYFAADLPFGFGGFDIYKSENKNNIWSKPENLGNQINSGENEFLPFINEDGTLFYSVVSTSKKLLEVKISSCKTGNWQKSENCSQPLDKSARDFGLSTTENIDNLAINPSFNTEQKSSHSFFKGVIRDKETNQGLDEVEILLLTGKTAKYISSKSNSNGDFSIEIKPLTYKLIAKKNGYFSTVGDFTATSNFNLFWLEFDIQKIDFEKEYLIKNITFDSITHFPSANSATSLFDLADLLKENPTLEIELIYYIFTEESLHFEQVIAEKRLNTLLQFLALKEANPKRITLKVEAKNQVARDLTETKAPFIVFKVLKQ